MGVLVRGLQRNRNTHTHTHIHTYRQRSPKSAVSKLDTQRFDGIIVVQVLLQSRTVSKTDRERILSCSGFFLFRPSTDCMRSTHMKEGNLLYSLYQVKC